MRARCAGSSRALRSPSSLLLVTSVPGWHGSPNRHSLVVAGIPVAVALLAVYLWITVKNLRIHRDAARAEPGAHAWSLSSSLATLGAATLATAFVSEILVHSLHAFGKAVGLNEFFIAVVIVAIVGNAAEHGGAIVIAKRGNTPARDRDRDHLLDAGGAVRRARRRARVARAAPPPVARVPAGRDRDDGARLPAWRGSSRRTARRSAGKASCSSAPTSASSARTTSPSARP